VPVPPPTTGVCVGTWHAMGSPCRVSTHPVLHHRLDQGRSMDVTMACHVPRANNRGVCWHLALALQSLPAHPGQPIRWRVARRWDNVASSKGNGAGGFRVDAPGIFHICWNHLLNWAFSIRLWRRCSSVGCRYPPGFLCIRMNSMSFCDRIGLIRPADPQPIPGEACLAPTIDP